MQYVWTVERKANEHQPFNVSFHTNRDNALRTVDALNRDHPEFEHKAFRNEVDHVLFVPSLETQNYVVYEANGKLTASFVPTMSIVNNVGYVESSDVWHVIACSATDAIEYVSKVLESKNS